MKQFLSVYTALALFALITFTGCELKSEIYSAINPTIYPTTARDARDLVTANAYSVFKNGDYDGLYNVATGIILTSDMTSDYALCSWGDGGNWERLNFAAYTPNDTRNATHGWDFSNNISKMELTIERIQEIDFDETLKKQYIAELRCGQGFLAFQLYDLFGPLIIADRETLKTPPPSQGFPDSQRKKRKTTSSAHLTPPRQICRITTKKATLTSEDLPKDSVIQSSLNSICKPNSGTKLSPKDVNSKTQPTDINSSQNQVEQVTPPTKIFLHKPTKKTKKLSGLSTISKEHKYISGTRMSCPITTHRLTTKDGEGTK
jgi:hypothetical protein